MASKSLSDYIIKSMVTHTTIKKPPPALLLKWHLYIFITKIVFEVGALISRAQS
jgi:hypothetical protein